MTLPDTYNELKKPNYGVIIGLQFLHWLRRWFILPDVCFISLFHTDGFKSEVNYKTLKLEVCVKFR